MELIFKDKNNNDLTANFSKYILLSIEYGTATFMGDLVVDNDGKVRKVINMFVSPKYNRAVIYISNGE